MSSEPLSSNETFVQLMKVAQQDADVRRKLVAVLSLDKVNRQAALKTFINEMSLSQAPKDFIQAVAAFLDDDVAAQALSILKDEKKG